MPLASGKPTPTIEDVRSAGSRSKEGPDHHDGRYAAIEEHRNEEIAEPRVRPPHHLPLGLDLGELLSVVSPARELHRVPHLEGNQVRFLGVDGPPQPAVRKKSRHPKELED